MTATNDGWRARVFRLQPFSWDGRAGGVAWIAAIGGIVALGFGVLGGAYNIRTGHVAVPLLLIVGGAYHAIVGGLALREHYATTGDLDLRQAWTSAAMYGLYLPGLAALGWWGLSVGLQPFPDRAHAVTAPVERYWVDELSSDHVVFRLKLQGREPAFGYDCTHGSRSGWCGAYGALQAVANTHPQQAVVVPLGDEMAMLNLDGQDILSWNGEHWRRRLWPLIGGLTGGFFLLLFMAETVGWTRRALEIGGAKTEV